MRDPYAIYAHKVLGLRPLDPPGRAPDALDARHGDPRRARRLPRGDRGRRCRADAARGLRTRDRGGAGARGALAGGARALDRAAGARGAAGSSPARPSAAPAPRPPPARSRARATLDGAPLPFAVTAKADRIDRAPDGGYAIYDYKSGGVPTAPEAAAFHLQLPLEAAIAAAGGFDGLPAGRAVHLELIGVGARKTLALDPDPSATWARLVGLIAAYQDPAQGFVARLRPQKLTYASDYDHLSRLGEWADGDRPAAEDVA